MYGENNCPCEAVKQLQALVNAHEKRLAQGNTDFALVRQDLQFIREKIEKKEKFNGNVFLYVIQAMLTLIMGYVALKLGI